VDDFSLRLGRVPDWKFGHNFRKHVADVAFLINSAAV